MLKANVLGETQFHGALVGNITKPWYAVKLASVWTAFWFISRNADVNKWRNLLPVFANS